MQPVALEPIRAQIAASRAWQRLRDLAEQQSGTCFELLLRATGTVETLDGSLHPAPAPFCARIRSTDEGRRRCLTCRTLVTLAATCHGLVEYVCHGDVCVVAAPVEAVFPPDCDASLVVAACAFASSAAPSAEAAIRAQAADLGIDPDALVADWARLPRMDADGFPLVRRLVDVAATTLGELLARPPAPAPGKPAGPAGVATEPPATGPRPERTGGAGFRRATERIAERIVAAARIQPLGGAELARSRTTALVTLVCRLICEDPTLPYTLARVARAAQMTPNHFSAVFQQQTGQRFGEFLLEQRLTMARQLLRDPRLTIAEVAFRVGFNDAAHFARRFRAAVGLTPHEWRAR